MAKVTYEVVEHDGGWAYKVGDVFSETFDSHERAHRAAEEAAARQQLGGTSTIINYEDGSGEWRTEIAKGGDRPKTDVVDEAGKGAPKPVTPRDRAEKVFSRDVGAEEPLPDGPNR